MSGFDPYEVLGVERDATVEAIHRSYRERARAAHPDLAGDDDRMAALNEAWAVLRDPVRRAAYDQAGATPAVAKAEAPAAPDPLLGRRTQRLLRAIVLVSLTLAVALLVIVFLVGFGRVGS